MKLIQKFLTGPIATVAMIALCQQMTHTSGYAAGGNGGGGGSKSTAPKVVTPIDDKGGTVVKGGGGNGGGGNGGGSKGGGGGGKKSTTPAPAPTPEAAPATTPIMAATLTYAAVGPINDVLPVCTGSYQIDPYYPTLLDLTVNVHVSSLNVADGTVLYIDVVGTAPLYPYTSNAIIIAGGSGSCSEKLFIIPGDSVAGVLIKDSLGNVIFAGN